MRSASAWTAAVALAMLAAAAAYLGAFLHAGFSDGPRTAEAAHRVRRDTLALRGIVIREERLLPPEEKPVYLTAADGVRVAAGRTLGIRGESGEELVRGWLLQRLREESAPPVSA
ncbi:MAG: hypothetical protein IKQ10_02615, partial [Oscillospiraceae bacterium]|nr:hypothetical protein [Oscillospiraceae bacterium]